VLPPSGSLAGELVGGGGGVWRSSSQQTAPLTLRAMQMADEQPFIQDLMTHFCQSVAAVECTPLLAPSAHKSARTCRNIDIESLRALSCCLAGRLAGGWKTFNPMYMQKAIIVDFGD
jgi:hypothetical protein